MKRFNRVEHFDRERGLVEMQAGIEWPDLIEYLHREQADRDIQWAIREKQTGVDRVSIGGSLAANAHGRGLRFPPLVCDVESFLLIDAEGDVHCCSRRENQELFSLAIGGYGLFGVIANVTLRLVHRVKVRRVVQIIPVRDLLPWVDTRIEQGFMYGDCQYETDLRKDAAAHLGVFACYVPVGPDTLIPEHQRELSASDWIDLYRLARTNKARAFDNYSAYYASTSGQVYWSDTHQLAGAFDSYRQAVGIQGTEMLTEVYISRDAFLPYLARVRRDFVEHGVDVTYGTIRFIEADADSFLAWARQPSVCVTCNLHVNHTSEGIRKVVGDFRRILDRTVEYGGTYYLTYHRWATQRHTEACHPRFVEFLRLKKKYDPEERFQSDWYRHYREMFADRL
jgi:FAD/FMN-containing dehydrogenase